MSIPRTVEFLYQNQEDEDEDETGKACKWYNELRVVVCLAGCLTDGRNTWLVGERNSQPMPQSTTNNRDSVLCVPYLPHIKHSLNEFQCFLSFPLQAVANVSPVHANYLRVPEWYSMLYIITTTPRC